MKFNKIHSVVIVAVKKNRALLLLKDDKMYVWHFPSKEFDEALNGNLDDTVKRVLSTFTNFAVEIDYLGSFLRKEGDHILIGYNFLIENFKGEISAKFYKWANEDEIKNTELDKNTLTFLKLHKELIKI